MDYAILTTFILGAIGGFITLSYGAVAQNNGWNVGTLFARRFSVIQLFGAVGLWGGTIASAFYLPWWSFIIVFGSGFVGAKLIIGLFRSGSQIISILLLLSAGIMSAIYIF